MTSLRRNKYGAKATVVDGIRFHSVAEAQRWMALCLLQKAGLVSDLRRQVPYPIEINGHKVTTYVADFVYREPDRGGAEVVEDSKGYRTSEYRIKRALMLAVHGVEIRETGRQDASITPRTRR